MGPEEEEFFAHGLLTLVEENGQAMDGRVSWANPGQFTFRIAGDGPEDPGLRFTR